MTFIASLLLHKMNYRKAHNNYLYHKQRTETSKLKHMNELRHQNLSIFTTIFRVKILQLSASVKIFAVLNLREVGVQLFFY